MNEETVPSRTINEVIPFSADKIIDASDNHSQPEQVKPYFKDNGEPYHGSNTEEWRVGDVILDTYEVKEVFRGGAMGLVYRVFHRNWNVDLIVKTPRKEYYDTETHKQNFIREAETWIDLGLHPHIVSCYYVREIDSIPRVFAEFVEGGALKDWIGENGEGRLYEGGKKKALERILDIAIQFAWGLHFAHEKGLVHQDVKPANVLVTSDGTVKVTDFGLARAGGVVSQSGGRLNVDGSVLVESGGMTPAYASPEQASGRPLSRKTDIWSWALSVLEIFTGEMTWMQGEVALEVLEDYLSSGTDYEKVPEMPKQLANLLRNCFSTNSEDRPRDFLTIAAKLREIYRQEIGRAYEREYPKDAKLLADSLNNKAVSLMDLGKTDEAFEMWEKATKIQPHHLEASFNLALNLWRNGKIDYDVRGTMLFPVFESNRDKWTANYVMALMLIEYGSYALAITELEKIQITRENKTEVEAIIKKAKDLEAKSKKAIQKFEINDSVTGEEYFYDLAITPNGNKALTIDSQLKFRLFDIATGTLLKTFNENQPFKILPPNYIPGGHRLSVNSDSKYAVSVINQLPIVERFDGQISQRKYEQLKVQERYFPPMKLWDLDSGKCIQTFDHRKKLKEKDSITTVAISPDGQVAASGGGKALILWSAKEGKVIWKLDGAFDSAIFSPDGCSLLVANEKNVILVDVELGEVSKILAGHDHPVTSVCFSFDGQYYLSGDGNGTLKLWDVKTGNCVRTLDNQGYSLTKMEYENRRTLVSLSADNKYAICGFGATIYQVWDVETGRSSLIEISSSPPYGVATFLPSSNQAILSDGLELRVAKISTADFRTNYLLSRFQTSEQVLSANIEYTQLIERAKAAIKQEDLPQAVRLLRQARSFKGYERMADAVELWVSLYEKLPKKTVSGLWKPDAEFAARLQNIHQFKANIKVNADKGNGGIQIKELSTGKLVGEVSSDAGTDAIVISPDGRLSLLIDGNVVKVHDNIKGKLINSLSGHDHKINNLKFSGNGKFVVSSGRDTVRLWDIGTGKCIRVLSGFNGPITFVSTCYYGRFILSSCLLPPAEQDYPVKLWDAVTGYCKGGFNLNRSAKISLSAVISADGRFVYTVGDNNKIENLVVVWDAKTGEGLNDLNFHVPIKDFLPAGISFDGKFVVSPPLNIYSLETSEKLSSQMYVPEEKSVGFSNDGRFVIAEDELWLIDWDLEERKITDWDEEAQPYVDFFLKAHQGANWENNFDDLIRVLKCAGLGYIRPEGVRRRLEKISGKSSKTNEAVQNRQNKAGLADLIQSENEKKQSLPKMEIEPESWLRGKGLMYLISILFYGGIVLLIVLGIRACKGS